MTTAYLFRLYTQSESQSVRGLIRFVCISCDFIYVIHAALCLGFQMINLTSAETRDVGGVHLFTCLPNQGALNVIDFLRLNNLILSVGNINTSGFLESHNQYCLNYQEPKITGHKVYIVPVISKWSQ